MTIQTYCHPNPSGGGKIEHPAGGQGGFTGGFFFNAHIGVKDNICFVNWGDFTRKCEESKSDEFIADLNRKGLKRLATLLQSDKYTFYKDDKNHIHGFSWLLTGDSGVSPANNLSFFHSLMLSSLQPLLATAVEVWQSTRLLPLRNLLRRCVLLHRDPITDRLVPVNSDMEDMLYDKTGMPRQITDIEDEKLTDYVKKIEHALGNSMAVDGINYAFIICCQLLSSVSGYIGSALETNPTTTFTKLDNCCTAAYNAIISYKEHLDNMTFPTSQEETRRKELLKQYEKATSQLGCKV